MKNYRDEAIRINDEGKATAFTESVVRFAVDGFPGAIKRKTWNETDREMLALLKEMVAELEKKHN